MVDIKPMGEEFAEYLRDESRTTGFAQTISFPTNEAEVREVLHEINPQLSGQVHSDLPVTPITIQGGRTGLAAGAVPFGGHVLNLSKMNRILGLRREELPEQPQANYYVRVQPGVVLSTLRKYLEDRNMPTDGWDAKSKDAWAALSQDREYFFPTDPTETSATIGGIVACNASGARSYHYGPARPHVSALRLVLADGDVISVRRGQVYATGRCLHLVSESGRKIVANLPTYVMPQAKNASGYYACDNEDAIDIIIGSDGTLGVITEIELALTPLPTTIWGVSCFFDDEKKSIDFTEAVRPSINTAAAIEFFDADALDILRTQKANSTAFSSLLAPPDWARCCVYVELQCTSDDEAYEQLYKLGDQLRQCGGSEEATWVGRTSSDREQQRFFRHAVPESVNMLIDERRKSDPTITKLGSDMSVPNGKLRDVVALYRSTLKTNGLQSAVWGHIGNNHLHVNVLPRNAEDFAKGKQLFASWAKSVTDMGGAVSAEHGIGKLKRNFLLTMYGPAHIAEMAQLKQAFDPACVFDRGNLFDESLLHGVTLGNSEEA